MTLAEWTQYVLFVFAGWLLRTLVTQLYLAVKRWVDRVIPDNLDVGAGAWLRSAIHTRNMNVRLFVEPTKSDDIDAFYPSARVVRLSQEVYFKRDPSFWAVAAHELGHAIVWGKSRLIGVPLSAARFFGGTLTSLGGFLIFANILYGLPAVSTFAFDVYIVGTGLFVFTLADEAAASILAMRMLRADGRIDAHGLRGALFRLVAAYLTYVGAFAGQIVLVFQQKWITKMIAEHRHFVPASKTSGSVLIVVLAILLAGASIHRMVRTVRRPTLGSVDAIKKEKLRELLRWIACDVLALILVWRVWDQPFGPTFAIACILALFGSRLGVALVSIPVALVLGLVLHALVFAVMAIASRFSKRETTRTESTSPSAAELEETIAMAEELYVDSYNHPEWHETALKLVNGGCQLGFAIVLLQYLR